METKTIEIHFESELEPLLRVFMSHHVYEELLPKKLAAFFEWLKQTDPKNLYTIYTCTTCDTVDGRNPAPVDMVVYPILSRVLCMPGGCWDFFHQQYLYKLCHVIYSHNHHWSVLPYRRTKQEVCIDMYPHLPCFCHSLYSAFFHHPPFLPIHRPSIFEAPELKTFHGKTLLITWWPLKK